MSSSNTYDVIIIGAGIGGLVCGCYLAKAGLKVLIIEKNANPGGYCNSFEVKGYKFDGCVHSLGNISRGGKFFEIINELDIERDLDLIKHNPSDVLIVDKRVVCFYNDVEKTIKSFAESFPKEKKSIKAFFNLLLKDLSIENAIKFRRVTFRNLLDKIFNDEDLKDILSLPLLGNMGMPSYQINAFSAIKQYQQFMIDGGYYPKNGIQQLPDVLAKRIKQFGGGIILSKTVIKVEKKEEMFELVLKSNERFRSKFVVSNCDARQTFKNLLGENNLPKSFYSKLLNMKPALTLFVIYLGLKNGKLNLMNRSNSWFLLNKNFDKNHSKAIDYKTNISKIDWFLISPNYEAKTAMIFAQATYMDAQFWIKNKKEYTENVINEVDKRVKGFKDIIDFKVSVTPQALESWTNNFSGSGFGWASNIDQFMDTDFSLDSIVKNLFLCGHWSTVAQGVPGVVIVGKNVASKISKRYKEYEYKL